METSRKNKEKLFRVEFEDTDHVGIVKSGSTIMKAARKAGVYINTICGGEGLCGKCRVTVREGRVSMKPNSFLNSDEIQEGYVIACLTKVLSNIRVKIPEESSLDKKPVFDEDRSSGLSIYRDIKKHYSLSPLCRKGYLELQRPSIHDHLSDLDRVKSEFDRTIRLPIMRVDFENIRLLPDILRRSDFKLTVTYAYKEGAFEMIQFEGGDTSGNNYGIAVDVGTTTVMANLINLNDGNTCASETGYNSQMQHGEDIISRIVYTQENKNGLDKLNREIIKDIKTLISALTKQCGIRSNDINYMVCTGNTVMIHILLGITLDNIRREPYIPVLGDPPAIHAEEIGIDINRKGYIGFLPGFGAYVGSDITGAVLASGMAREKVVSLLIDVGTNGEIALGNIDWLICCSASAGPAFEGAGTRCGMRAVTGAIEKVRIYDDGTVELRTIGGKKQKPMGICGSGYIDLVAELFAAGFLDRTGRFKTDNNNPRIREGEIRMEFLLAEKVNSAAGRDIVITEEDIATLIRTKGAIFTAAEAILEHVGLTWANIDRIFISGGFGNFLDVRRSIIIGLLPDLEPEKFIFIGNGSLAGGQICMLSLDALMMSKRLARRMTYFDLSTNPWFMKEYTSSLFLPHTDLEKFPTVMSPEST